MLFIITFLKVGTKIAKYILIKQNMMWRSQMNKSICKNCINIEICGNKNLKECDHCDIELSRSEIINMLNDIESKNPKVIPAILNAVKETYKIQLAF